jgi:hypothetical protein
MIYNADVVEHSPISATHSFTTVRKKLLSCYSCYGVLFHILASPTQAVSQQGIPR